MVEKTSIKISLDKLRQNPKQVSSNELKQVLEDYGFTNVRRSR